MSSSSSPSSIATLLRQRLEHIVDQLPAECDVLPEHRQPKKPRFLNAVLVMADRTKCGDDLLKATLQKQLDPYPEKESPGVEEAPQKSEIEEKEHSNQVGQRIEHYENGVNLSNGHNGGNKQQLPIIAIDAIAEAVRVLREADKMLERKLQQNGWSLEIAPQPTAAEIVVPKSPAKAAVATTNGSTTFPRSQKQQTVGFTSSTATTTTTSATAAGSSSSSRRPSLFASSINFPSELRKYKIATVDA